jgi:opacity protein-like surface antigen
MKKLLLAAAMAVSVAAAASAADAATYVVGPIYGPGATATGTFGDNFTVAGNFTSTITFLLAKAGTLSSSITTTFAGKGTNINFSSAKINGNAYTLTPTGAIEFGSIALIPVAAGLQTIIVKGTTMNNASYSGQFSFIPSVPETATWGMMLLGVAGMGAVLRRGRVAAVAA